MRIWCRGGMMIVVDFREGKQFLILIDAERHLRGWS
jgi:hypothetical protein